MTRGSPRRRTSPGYAILELPEGAGVVGVGVGVGVLLVGSGLSMRHIKDYMYNLWSRAEMETSKRVSVIPPPPPPPPPQSKTYILTVGVGWGWRGLG